MGTILIVEDNELNIKLFKDLLSKLNHKTIILKDGENIIDVVEKKRPNLILMDIQLNGISGLDLIKKLKSYQSTKLIPIIAITAFAMKDEKIKISQSGCELYLSKPVSIEKFFNAVEGFITKQQTY